MDSPAAYAAHEIIAKAQQLAHELRVITDGQLLLSVTCPDDDWGVARAKVGRIALLPPKKPWLYESLRRRGLSHN